MNSWRTNSRHSPILSRRIGTSAFLCIDPIETAADKLSALAWRVCIRERGAERDDPTIIRHLHDLAALQPRIATSDEFSRLVLLATTNDTDRGGGKAPIKAGDRFSMMPERLGREAFWALEYTEYVRRVSYARPGEGIMFDGVLGILTEPVGSLDADGTPDHDR